MGKEEDGNIRVTKCLWENRLMGSWFSYLLRPHEDGVIVGFRTRFEIEHHRVEFLIFNFSH